LYLIVDIGNTLAKLFLYKKSKCIVQQKVVLALFIDIAASVIKNHPDIEGLIYSDVSNHSGDFFEKLSNQFPVISVNSQMQLPFKNIYKSPSTLGSDRIVLVAAACKCYPKTNVLIVDLGSCITYDFLDSENTYHGGAISPGFDMRYKALYQFTGNLPFLASEKVEKFEGKSTEESIHTGVYFGILDEIKAKIEYYDHNYDSLIVILTGGDANKLPKTLKNSIFAHSNFLAEGMFHLLKLNIDLC